MYILCISTDPETPSSFTSHTEIERFVYHLERNHSDHFQDYMDDMIVEARIESCEISTDLEEFKRFVNNVHAHSTYLDMHFLSSEDYEKILSDYDCSLEDCSESERDSSPTRSKKCK